MSSYHPLTLDEAMQLSRTVLDLFDANSELTCQEIGDGNLNLVFHITDTNSRNSVIVKQALPYAKIVGESWPLSLDRARIEREILQEEYRICPGSVPQVYYYDDELALTIMEDLSDHVIMRKGLIEGNHYPLFSKHIGEFMARTLFYTSDLAMDQSLKKEKVKKFVNPDQCKITEDLIFEEPYRFSERNNYSPSIEDEAEALRTDHELHLEIAILREKFLTQAQALLHGDLHTGSIFITPESTKVIDPEFAYYGPIGFDIGAILANLLLHYVSVPGWVRGEAAVSAREEELLLMVQNVWTEFERSFCELWDQDVQDYMARTKGYQEFYVAKLLQDSAGYAGSKMIRRIVGLAHVADIDTINDETIREQAERKALSIGKNLVKNHRKITSITDFMNLVIDASKGKVGQR
ncbi:S-methyl-5-thioribose kinase [Paenibacillus gallinarum]|uniref:Methylthioribose kinase n=1 Tax=Paenibacillus gallinarum TaxID=2762232 RepID=A0ABR8STW1_9BACL|nr:S-methyl-5-thioribose kinase [Paenibacillus gallinarum]MBD7966936.1 S-methyl-5-thioribose kinase [Paenibacillus gallinarum]